MLNHQGTRTLETRRLILRRFVPGDLHQIYQNCWSDYEVWKWTSYAPMQTEQAVITSAEMFTDRWLNAYARPNRYSWAITLKDTGEVIGRFFGMHPDDRVGQVELAYELGRNWWNQGLMTEAVQAVIDYFFTVVGFNRIYAFHAPENPASGRVMQKCGMTREGTLRQAERCNYGIVDAVVYSILSSEYRRLSPISPENDPVND